jgi:very-short-patch-repair endonuclease
LAAILALAARQHGVVTRAQLLDAGMSVWAIRHRVRTGRLHRLHPGVFAVGRPRVTQEGVWLAAVLACGRGAALSHLSAGALWGIRDRPHRRPQVSVPTGAGRAGPRGIDLRRAATLRPEHVTTRERVPVTTLTRTLVDLAAVLDHRQVKSAVRQAERLHKLDLARLRIHLDGSRRSTGHARLRRLLDAYVPAAATENDLEAAFLELCERRALPMPETQVPIGPYRADFLWRDLRLIVETDGRDSHDGYIAFRDDRVRDRAMKAAGFEVLRFARAEVVGEPGKVARELSGAVDRLTGGALRTP